MTAKEKKILKKTPAKEVRRLYEELVDAIRSTKLSTDSPIYKIGWTDGYNVGRRK